jgi:hypothetical protein
MKKDVMTNIEFKLSNAKILDEIEMQSFIRDDEYQEKKYEGILRQDKDR